MSLNLDKAYAARRVRALNEQLPEGHRLDLGDAWKRLERDLDLARSAGAAELVLID